MDKLANWSVGVDIACRCNSGTEYGTDIYQAYKPVFVPPLARLRLMVEKRHDHFEGPQRTVVPQSKVIEVKVRDAAFSTVNSPRWVRKMWMMPAGISKKTRSSVGYTVTFGCTLVSSDMQVALVKSVCQLTNQASSWPEGHTMHPSREIIEDVFRLLKTSWLARMPPFASK